MRAHKERDGIYERDGSPFWWATWTDSNGKKIRRSTAIRREDDSSKTRAKEVRENWIKSTAFEVIKESNNSILTFDNLMALYLEGPALDKKAPERDFASLKVLAPVFQGRDLLTINGADVRAYIKLRQSTGISAGTLNREIGLMSSALNWAKDELEWNVPNPFQRRRLKEPDGRDRWLKPHEAEALIRAAEELPRSKFLADFIRLGLYTGMRPGEILHLDWNRVDLHRNLIFFNSSDQKNGKKGSIPINEKARKTFLKRLCFRAEFCPDSPWVFCNKEGERIANVKKSFASARKAAGLRDVHPHDLRRTCGAWLAIAGVSIKEIAAILRHSDIRITDRVYTPLAPDTLRGPMAALDGPSSQCEFTITKALREVTS